MASLLSDVLRPRESILVSCCNVGRFGSRYSLAVITAQGVGWLNLDDVINPGTDTGLSGLLLADGCAFAVVQSTPPRIVRLNEDLRPSAQYQLERGLDIHSIVERDGTLYAASTGRNEILSLQYPQGAFGGGEQVHLRAAKSAKNTIHLNSLCFAGDSLLYSQFGERSGTTRSGAVVNASSRLVLRDEIRDPHSLTDFGSGIIGYCESLTSSFCLLDLATGGVRKAKLSGYTRGCTFTGRHFLVGASSWRHRSRSLGSLRGTPPCVDPHANPWQRSAIFFLNSDLSIAHRLEFTGYAPEIYDIAYAGTRFVAASVFQDAAGRRLDALYDEIHSKRAPGSDYYISKRA